ncbi:hypothetical protein GJ744_000839 [Endocarpon pusillum]|uniref:C2H2-type domain-containing protein n=1 Tax=Endocarpon pusillum TaxID=364733 RepID=A0A8H7E8X4_9EURO|nr:hypothetical protein GJ744_000839 [Endocarpon pusillum]
MSGEASLGTLVDELEAHALVAHDRCRHASSDFDTVEWDITCLRFTLKEIKHELSQPNSKIRSAEQARQEALATIVKSYRPLLHQIHQFATKDQGFKKKRIWRSHKPNSSVLDRFHRELQFQTQTINLYLSTLTATTKPGPAQEAPGTLQAVHQGSEADAQWSLLRLRLIEDGITDTDIEAHTTSIRALLQERLPSYHDLPSGPRLLETHNSCDTSAGSHENVLQRVSQPEYSASGKGRYSDQVDQDQDQDQHVHSGASTSFSPGVAPIARNGSTNSPLLTKDNQPLLTRTPNTQPASPVNKSEGMFYIGDSSDSESEVLHFSKERYASGPSSPRPTTKMISPMPQSTLSSHKHQSSASHEAALDGAMLEHHDTTVVWSCAAIYPDEAAFFDCIDDLSVSVCGLCGELVRKSPDVTQRKKHLSNIHKWHTCNRDELFYRADDFRQHLKHSHHAVPGGWSQTLERSARRKVHRPQIPDASNHASPSQGSTRSRLRAQSSTQHQNLPNPSNAEVMQRPSSNSNGTESMHRVHSDISEYDAQGNLLKRTITDSYTSVADAAALSLERHRSSSRPHTKKALTAAKNAPFKGITQGKFAPLLSQDQSHLGHSCPFCSTSQKFSSRALLARHMSVTHKDFVARPIQAVKHQKLKRAYKKLHSTLRSLCQNRARASDTGREGSVVTEHVIQLLDELDDEFWPSSSESAEDSMSGEHPDPDDVDVSDKEEAYS